MKIEIERLPHCYKLPQRQTDGASGFDIYAAAPLTLQVYQRGIVPAGFKIAIPRGHEGQIRPRSGLAMRRGLTVLNTPGTIDSDYRGEVAVLLANISFSIQTIDRGDRIAQLVIVPVCHDVEFNQTAIDRAGTERGAGGFGSTGGFTKG